MKKNLCFLTPQFKTGGGNRVFVELANVLVKNFNVDIVYPNNSNNLHGFYLNNKINIEEIGKPAQSMFGKFCNLIKMLCYVRIKKRKSIVIMTDPIMSIFSPILFNANTFRFVQANDCIIFDDLMLLKNKLILLTYKTLAKISYRYKINYIFNSKYTYDSFFSISGRNDVGYNLVHPAIDHRIFFNQCIRDKKELNLCLVARKHPWKGFSYFIEAWKRLEKDISKKINNIYIISHDDLSDFDLSNCPKIILIKPKNDSEIADIYNKSHIFISTSWWEGFGLPPLEAMSCGCAVILTDAGGVNEYAEPGLNCLMCQPRDIDHLNASLSTLVKNPEMVQRLGNMGVNTAKNFSWERSANQLLKILNDVS